MADDLVRIRMETVEEGAIDEVGRGGRGERARGLVGVADAAVVDDEDGGGGALEDGAELLLAGEGRAGRGTSGAFSRRAARASTNPRAMPSATRPATASTAARPWTPGIGRSYPFALLR